MHVLVTADTVGGVWTYARELVTGLVRRGVEVTLVSFGNIPTAQQMDWMDGLRGFHYRPTAFRLEWMQEAEEDMEPSADYLQSVVEELKPDLLHTNQFFYGALRVDIPKILVAHSDVVSWWGAVHGEDPRDTKWMRWYRGVVADGLSRATTVIAPSRWMLDAVATYYIKPADGRVIYNGRSPQLFNPHVSKEDYVLTVGRIWDGGKQTALLLQDDLPMTAYIVGSEVHPDQAFRSNGAAGLVGKSRIHFKGEQDEGRLRALYARASIYAATSRYEPFGLAPLEAALSRCALLMNDIPTFREIWGDTAIYFRANDAASLNSELTRLKQDRELRLTYAALACQRAQGRYSAERMVDDYLALYHSVVQAGVAA